MKLTKRWPICYPKNNLKHHHDKEWSDEVQVQDKQSRRDHMHEDCHPHGSWMWKTFPKKRFPHMSMGEQFVCLHQAFAIKKEGPSWDKQDHHHLAQVDHARGKGMILIGCLSLTGLVVVVVRPGYRIDNHSIKLGSRRSESARTFASLASSFLVIIWSLSMRGFRVCVIIHDKL